jgi:hypothetical protein
MTSARVVTPIRHISIRPSASATCEWVCQVERLLVVGRVLQPGPGNPLDPVLRGFRLVDLGGEAALAGAGVLGDQTQGMGSELGTAEAPASESPASPRRRRRNTMIT